MTSSYIEIKKEKLQEMIEDSIWNIAHEINDRIDRNIVDYANHYMYSKFLGIFKYGRQKFFSTSYIIEQLNIAPDGPWELSPMEAILYSYESISLKLKSLESLAVLSSDVVHLSGSDANLLRMWSK